MTSLLVSVRNAAEAQAALRGGADIIDVKEPRNGSLGASDVGQWEAIADTVGTAKPLSVALGEVEDAERLLEDTRCRIVLERYQFAKVGMAGLASRTPQSVTAAWLPRWKRVADRLPPAVQRVAVVYADFACCDAPAPQETIRLTGDAGCKYVLVDTFDKSGGSLLDHWGMHGLDAFSSDARFQGMQVVCAGSLRLAHLPAILSLKPDLVAVRSAVCPGPRDGPIEESLVRKWAELLASHRQQLASR